MGSRSRSWILSSIRNNMVSEARKRARSFPLLLYHLLSTSTLPFWTIFLGVLSPILIIIKEGIAKGGKHMSSYVLGFQDIDKTKLMVVGGKGSNLGELSRIEGIRVPEGFCITTEAYKRIISQKPEFNDLLEQLSLLKVEDRERICEISKKIRSVIEGT